ncbi:CheY-like chemotaxis protein [Thermonema lapsum]|uniref:CheY-like chemotaxis protein n=1 Tax=Thermonema lapsum TaxID=28195 RepID=A0A846MP97_9BACT|nr:response regulator [Thermonema lapsum]NIK73386.1 CheY-like chemotaxis protein [Thermonema lapsum]
MSSFPLYCLIDDDEISNLISATIIQKVTNAQVVTFTRASEALEYLQHTERLPDAIFLDINMPEMNGWEFLEALETLPDAIKDMLQIYMLSSSIDIEDQRKAETYKRVKGYIAKPLSPDKMMTTVASS